MQDAKQRMDVYKCISNIASQPELYQQMMWFEELLLFTIVYCAFVDQIDLNCDYGTKTLIAKEQYTKGQHICFDVVT